MSATHPYAPLLAEGAKVLGLSLSSAQADALHAYLSELTTWNQRLNLTSIRDPELMVRHHLIDCISVVPLLRPEGNLLDVGSGAGLPGIPISIMCPDKIVTLLEPRRKRANFLRHVSRTLRLTNIRVLESRIQSLTPDGTTLTDETIARAFIDNEGFLHMSARLLRPQGTCFLMHGPKGVEFLATAKQWLAEIGLSPLPPKHFRLPFGDEERTVLLFTKLDSDP